MKPNTHYLKKINNINKCPVRVCKKERKHKLAISEMKEEISLKTPPQTL